ncbi:Nuclear pore complex protein NUP54 [Capsicum chinense]|uniref:Nuclear pore complex protein NUP54 n=1 Tax=Capsicum annuum TaxID=4072 RepID=A0A1U8GNX0_CAPAN|nr:nuclear pore complex protein NUP54 isoform X1 [Capsicum annuum]KAF3622382.1 Nuclear pore complex protein NUP54 [Capsicum annuum]PHT83669.1 Nuclear pore complex protein NUP54 [Capsicum annuum]PHU19932.1 Nuclear pore complex protein NUP54 [Capsicum chinense]
MFGAQPSSSFGTPFSTPAFGTPSSTPAFGTPSTPSFGTGFGSSLFSTPLSQQSQPHQQQTSLFQTPQSSGPFSFFTPLNTATQAQSSSFGQPNLGLPLPFANAQLTTQMAPMAPLPFSLADRDIQAIVDAYKEEPSNPKYAFKHLLSSVTEPQYRTKPAGVSDIMWAEAMAKLEGMESIDRERLWPQLVQGFKDLSERLKLQDEVIVSDAERLQMTQSNVKMLQRHFQADTLPWIERMRHKEQGLQRRLLRVMRILEALQGKGCRLPLMKREAELVERLTGITRQLKGSGAELSRRVQNLLTICRVQNGLGGGSVYLPGSTKIHEQSLADMQEVLQQQTEAIARLGNVLKRDIRDVEIIMSEEIEMMEGRV